MQAQDEEEIIEQYQALVKSIALKYEFSSHHLSLQDLQQEGNIGLLKAIRKFDSKRKIKFVTYAYYWVRASITRAIREQATTIRVPNYMYDAISKCNEENPVRKATRESDEYFLARTKKYLSQHDDCQATDLRGLENSPSTVDVFTDVKNKFLHEKLSTMIEDLGFREKEVLKHRFPFLKENPLETKNFEETQKKLTFKELGEELGITDSRAHQIEKEALQKLRRKMTKNALPVRVVA